MPRNRTKKKASSKDGPPMTDEQWSSMVSYGSFAITNADDGTDYKFCKGDIATILPADREPGTDIELWEYWVGRIKDIRAILEDDGSNSVWAKVQWYYSGRDVAGVVKSFDPGAVSRFERVCANHHDYVDSQSFEAVISMAELDEEDPEPPDISRDQFFSRYTFEYKARTVKPKPGSTACMCHIPYNPDDDLPESVMHFCPRPSCRRAYHQSCLLAGKHKESSSTLSTTHVTPANKAKAPLRSARKHASPVQPKTKAAGITSITPSSFSSRDLRLLACSPDTDDNVDLEFLITISTPVQLPPSSGDTVDGQNSDTEPPKKKRRGRPSKTAPPALSQSEVVSRARRSLTETLSDCPPLLVEVAQQPMVRGKAFQGGGISGNLAFVTRARRLIYKILEGNPLPDEWESQVFGQQDEVQSGVDNAIVKIEGSKKALPAVVCPQCRSAI